MAEQIKCPECGRELVPEENRKGGRYAACRKKDGGCGNMKILPRVKKAGGKDQTNGTAAGPSTGQQRQEPAKVEVKPPAKKDGGENAGNTAAGKSAAADKSGERGKPGFLDRIFFR